MSGLFYKKTVVILVWEGKKHTTEGYMRIVQNGNGM